MFVTKQPCGVLLLTAHKFQRQTFGKKKKGVFYLKAPQFWKKIMKQSHAAQDSNMLYRLVA